MAQATLTADPTDGVADGAATIATTGAPKRRPNVGRVLLPLLALAVIAGGVLTYRISWQNAHYVSTDDAQVAGQPVPVGPMSAGRVVSVGVAVGERVQQGEVLAQVELPSVVGAYQNGAPQLTFLGPSDQRLDIRSPIAGVVMAVLAGVGATVGEGQPVVTLVDPSHLWVSANVSEDQVARLRAGQQVSVYLDALHATLPGRVTAITPATAAAFSLLPQSNTSTNFTKVTQVAPVLIAVDLGNQAALLGSSASVQIRVS